MAVTLRDESVVTLRPFTVADSPRVAAFFDGLSPEARRMRFFGPMPRIGPSLVRALVEVDQVHHLAWGAFVDDSLGGSRCVGEVRAVRLRSDPSLAEIAFAVADGQRRIGLGRRLVEAIGVVASAGRIDTFVASVLSDNAASGALLNDLGMSFRFADGARQGTGPIPPWTGSAEVEDRIGFLARCAAGATGSLATVA